MSAAPALAPLHDDEPLEVSVVIPCLNEAGTLRAVVERAREALRDHQLSGEVLVADNGSTDGSVELALELGARVEHVPLRGYGNALRHGIRAARGRLVVMGDADDTYDFGELGRFVEGHRAGADLVMGTRLPPGRIVPGANPWLNRKVGTPALTFVLNRLFGTRIRDVNCGLRAIDRDKALSLDLRSEGMEFASEMLIKAAVAELAIAEVPVTLRPDRRGRPSHLRRWSDGWRHLEFMLLHAPDQLLFAPGLAMLAAGLALGLPLAFGPLHLAGRLVDYHFLILGGALTLIGAQGILGALLVRDVARGRVLRPNRLLSALGARLTLGRGLLAGGLLFLAGFAVDAVVLGAWIASGFGSLHEPRRAVLGMLLMTLGAVLGMNAFLHAALKRHV